MIAKFIDISQDQIMEVENNEKGVMFYITQNGEESIGQSITISQEEVANLIKFLTDIQRETVKLFQ
jgi:hypothetical protein